MISFPKEIKILAIVGSRKIKDPEIVREAIKRYNLSPKTIIVVDLAQISEQARAYANVNGIEIISHLPNPVDKKWATIINSQKVAEKCDGALVFPKGIGIKVYDFHRRLMDLYKPSEIVLEKR